MEIKAKDYKSRAELEAAIRTMPEKSDAEIVGTEDELKAKSLSPTTTVYGVTCRINGAGVPKPPKPQLKGGVYTITPLPEK